MTELPLLPNLVILEANYCNLSTIPLRIEPSDRSEIVSQILFGEHFEVLEHNKQWSKVKLHFDQKRMERLKSLDPPHKGLRNALSKLALIAGKTNYASINSVEKLKLIANDVFHLLKDHTATENKFILAPLEKVNPSFTITSELGDKFLNVFFIAPNIINFYLILV
jgi:hypothetical protein